MVQKKHLIVTSISAPNKVLKDLAEGSRKNGFEFILIGDTKSPADFYLEYCRFYDIQKQLDSGLRYAKLCPVRHYARKNIGYLIAMRENAEYIIETDDDNFPLKDFWKERHLRQRTRRIINTGWVNIYGYFSDDFIWPRGYPLVLLQNNKPALSDIEEIECPVQQGLADENPDVDAVYRLTYPLPKNFRKEQPIALGNDVWSPFNSQNTTWFPEAYALMYLPAYCSFRMTDIWRSFITLRILHENDRNLMFHSPTVWQERNEHNLMKDFEDEIPGYLNNERIVNILNETKLKKGREYNSENLLTCYQALCHHGIFEEKELELLNAWIEDINEIKKST
ncbi:MAG: DUF288 domain-containing protein [Calditrichaceae bacterium]|nr:DUF288 domain-containing protein [Calditrichaceae bacterium]MBN2707473.1 DUF288 domain-containing protein [Calditrichaceae bacterium]RQV94039.1 MAG: DUF288 domain-containing protein [Calditrichota bacterium]